MRELKKVTRFFGVLALALLVFALGFAAKHGQFEPESQHAHFLSHAVKMDKEAHRLPDGAAGVPAEIVIMAGPAASVSEDTGSLPLAPVSAPSHQRTLPLLV